MPGLDSPSVRCPSLSSAPHQASNSLIPGLPLLPGGIYLEPSPCAMQKPSSLRVSALSQAHGSGFFRGLRGLGGCILLLAGRLTSVLRSELKMDFPIEQSRALCFLCSVINQLPEPSLINPFLPDTEEATKVLSALK